MAWTSLTYAFNSLLTSTKMTQNQANFLSLAAGDSGAPSIVYAALSLTNDIVQGDIADDAIGQGELKTSTSAQSVVISANSDSSLALTGGSWSMWTGSADATVSGSVNVGFGNGNTAAGTMGLKNGDGQSRTFYVDGRYVTTSPPYKIGDIVWGHFFYVLRNISTGEILGTTEASDPTWAYNGLAEFDIEDIEEMILSEIAILEASKEFGKLKPDEKILEMKLLTRAIVKREKDKDKDSLERISAAPHPFVDYWDKPLPSGIEVALIDMRGFDIKQLKKDAFQNRKKVDQEILANINIGDEKAFSEFNVPEINGFTDKVKIRART